MPQNDVEDALTPKQVIDLFSCLIKDGFTENLLEKFAYINLGKYDVILNQEFSVFNSSKAEPEKKIFDGIILKAKNFPELLNATAISLIYRTVENASKEALKESINDGMTFISNVNSITNVLNQNGRGKSEGYSVYISDNPRQALKVLEYARRWIHFDNEKLTATEKDLDKDFDKEKLYILVCGYSYSLETSGRTYPYTLNLGTVDLTEKKAD